jgi:hypothetical protein
MAFDREKFKSLVHYVCWRCMDDPSKLGSVKLNKILGHQISGRTMSTASPSQMPGM